MDNLGSHKGQAVRQLIRSAGAKLFFLPRYSPDLNPIEQVFAKLKTLLRKTDPRTTRPPGTPSAHFSIASNPRNAPTTSSNAGYLSRRYARLISRRSASKMTAPTTAAMIDPINPPTARPSTPNNQPPISAPMTPTTIFPTRPKPLPRMICPASQPATAPTTKKMMKSKSVI
jgi:DDE superfamily endonuclease